MLSKELFENRINNDYTYVEHDINLIPSGTYVMYKNPYLNTYYYGGIMQYKYNTSNNYYIIFKNIISKKKFKVNSRGNQFYYKETNKIKDVSFKTILINIVKEHSKKKLNNH